MSEERSDEKLMQRVFRLAFKPSKDEQFLECYLEFNPGEGPSQGLLLGTINEGLLSTDEFANDRFTTLMKTAAIKMMEKVAGVIVVSTRVGHLDAEGNET